MNKFIKNIPLVLKDRRAMIAFAITFIIVGSVIYGMTDYSLIKGNLGQNYYTTWMIIDALFVISFSLFVAGFVYKSLLFWQHKNIWWRFGGFFGLLVTWCTSCSITIASYLWLAWLISLLPWWGIELKIIWLILVGYGVYNTYNKLTECDMRKK